MKTLILKDRVCSLLEHWSKVVVGSFYFLYFLCVTHYLNVVLHGTFLWHVTKTNKFLHKYKNVKWAINKTKTITNGTYGFGTNFTKQTISIQY